MKKRLRIILPLLLVGIIVSIGYLRLREGEDESQLRFSGNIELTEAQLGFRIPGQLTTRLVDEGDSIESGQLLAQLEASEQVSLVAQATANLDFARSVLAELLAGSRNEELLRAEAHREQAHQTLLALEKGSRPEELDRARAAEASAEASEAAARVQLDQARRDFERYAALFKKESISKEVFDNYQTLLETADKRMQAAQARTSEVRAQLALLEAGPRAEELEGARAALAQAEAELALVRNGPRGETIDQAKARVEMAREQLQQAELHLGYTRLTAPFAGVVLSVAAEQGEYLNPAAPVLTLGELARPWLRAYINETDLGRIRIGQKVMVNCDSYPGRDFAGTVSYISDQAEFTPKTVQTFEERVKLMYRIKVTLDNREGILKPGMPADGRIMFEGSQ